MGSAARHVKATFENRVSDQLETDHKVHWPGDDRFDASSHAEWVRPRDLGFTPMPVSGAGGKRIESWTFQIDCFANVVDDITASESSHRVWEMVDDVVDAFRLTRVDVLDFTTAGDPKVGELTFLIPDAEPIARVGDDGSTGDHVSVTIPAHYDDL